MRSSVLPVIRLIAGRKSRRCSSETQTSKHLLARSAARETDFPDHAGRFLRRWRKISHGQDVASRADNNASRYKAEVIAAARAQIASRIARFCTSLSAEQFDLLLDKMVRIHWKYDVLPHVDPSVDADHKSTIPDLFRGQSLS